jgi:hypothetical protein
MNGRSTLAILTSAVVFSGVIHAQGFYIETTHPGKDNEVTKLFYMPKMLKSVDPDGQISIFRLDKETLYTIDPEKKSYSSMTFEEMKAKMDWAKSNLSEALQKRLANLPPEKRKKLEETMAAMKNPTAPSEVNYQVTPTGENKSISGYACQKYIVKRNGKEFETVWTTKQISGFDAFKRDMQDVLDRFSSVVGTRRGMNFWFKDLEGFPIQTESHEDVSVARKVERRTIPSSEFEVPSGYTKETDKFGE